MVKVAKDVPLELVAPLGCGVQTGAGSVMVTFRPPYGSSLAVSGSGSVGLSAIMAARVVGCSSIIAVDVNEARLRLAEELGATHTITAGQGDLTEQIMDATAGQGVDFCLDTTGLQPVIMSASQALAIRGTLGLVGVSPPGTRVDLDPWAMLIARTVSGNMEGDVVPDAFIPYLLDLYAQGRFPFDRMIAQCGALDEINGAVEAIERGEVIKAVLTVA